MPRARSKELLQKSSELSRNLSDDTDTLSQRSKLTVVKPQQQKVPTPSKNKFPEVEPFFSLY
jgi:hypothetical protein